MNDNHTGANADLDEILGLIPAHLHTISGNALYTGRQAWSGQSDVYLLGYNPGGSPRDDTIAANTTTLFQNHPVDFSEYRDARWRERPPGTMPLQRRVLHLFNQIDVEPGSVPASNVIFARSARVATLDGDGADRYADDCWAFHATMIDRLGVKVIICMGGDAASFVRSKVGAHNLVDTFVEDNDRRWKSYVFTGPGPTVVQLTHPSIAKWDVAETDPTGLAVRALARARTQRA